MYIYYIWKLGFTLKFTFSEDASRAVILNLVRERTRTGECRDCLYPSAVYATNVLGTTLDNSASMLGP